MKTNEANQVWIWFDRVQLFIVVVFRLEIQLNGSEWECAFGQALSSVARAEHITIKSSRGAFYRTCEPAVCHPQSISCLVIFLRFTAVYHAIERRRLQLESASSASRRGNLSRDAAARYQANALFARQYEANDLQKHISSPAVQEAALGAERSAQSVIAFTWRAALPPPSPR